MVHCPNSCWSYFIRYFANSFQYFSNILQILISFYFQHMCSIIPLIAARLLILAMQWKWSLANNFQVFFLGISLFFTIFKLIQQVFHFCHCDTSFQEYFAARHFYVNRRLQVFPTSNRFLLWWIDCSSISFARAVLGILTSKADVVFFVNFYLNHLY